MAKAETYYLVYRYLTETGQEMIKTDTFRDSDKLKTKLAEIATGDVTNDDGEDNVIGVFQGREVKFNTCVKVEVNLQ